jgi:hypothetical protein
MLTLAKVAAHAGDIKAIVTTIVITVGVLVGVLGFSKLPGKVEAVASELREHELQARETNRKLDTLICLQAKLDTPLRCVAQNK